MNNFKWLSSWNVELLNKPTGNWSDRCHMHIETSQATSLGKIIGGFKHKFCYGIDSRLNLKRAYLITPNASLE